MELPAIGEIVSDRYELRSILGEGGHGRVYLAFDRRENRRVALKMLLSDDPQQRQRFGREVRVLGQLSSPHVAQLLDFGVSAAGAFAVFELVEGMDLSEALKQRGRFDEEATRAVLHQLLLALDEAHRAGLVHRDIKPENIRGTWDGRPVVKLLDFGIARPTDTKHASVTKTGELVGTPRYMSPEQLLGQPLAATSDIYSLGMVGYEMLVGSAEMHGTNIGDQLGRLRTGHLFGLPETVDATASLGEVIARMCATRPERRYSSAVAVQRALDGRDAASPPPDVASPPTTRGLAALAVGLVAACAALTSLLISLTDTPPEPPDEPGRREVAIVRSDEPPAPTPAPSIVLDAGRDTAEAPADGCGAPQLTGHRHLPPLERGRKPTVAYIPTTYDPDRAHPVVFLFHTDQDGGADAVVAHLSLERLADEHGFVIIAPRGGAEVAWKGEDDMRSAERDFEVAMTRLCIDRRRIYALGHGNGGRAVPWFVCRHPDVAAVATTAWVREREFPRCENHAAVPTLYFATLRSRYTPPAGGSALLPCLSAFHKLPLDAFEAEMRDINGCAATQPKVRKRADATCTTWQCETPFTSCHVDSGGLWPGAPTRGIWAACDGPPAKIDFGAEIWRFFAAHPAPDDRGHSTDPPAPSD